MKSFLEMIDASVGGRVKARGALRSGEIRRGFASKLGGTCQKLPKVE